MTDWKSHSPLQVTTSGYPQCCSTAAYRQPNITCYWERLSDVWLVTSCIYFHCWYWMHLTANPTQDREQLNTPVASVGKHVFGQEMSAQWPVPTVINGSIKTVLTCPLSCMSLWNRQISAGIVVDAASQTSTQACLRILIFPTQLVAPQARPHSLWWIQKEA